MMNQYCLGFAVSFKKVGIVKLFIESGMNLRSPEFREIGLPIERKDVDMLQLFLENGVSVEPTNINTIKKLCSIKNYEIAECLIGFFDINNDNEIKPITYGSMVNVGTRLNFSKTMLCLIEVSKNHNEYNRDNNIEIDEFHEHTDLFEEAMIMVNSKKRERLQNQFDETEYDEINKFGYENRVKVLNDRHYELVKSELVNQNFEMLKLLIEYGADVNSGNGLILRTAYKAGDIEWIEYFIGKGAKFDGESDGFEEACKSDKVEVLEHWIMKDGVVPKNPEYPCINMACLLDNFDMVKLLVENGVDLSDPERNGVRIACRLGLKRTLKYLLENNAVIEGVRHHQLEYACVIQDIRLVKMILEYYDGLGVLEKKDKTDSKEGEEFQHDSFLDNVNPGRFEEYKITKILLEKGKPIQNSDLLDGAMASIIANSIEILKILLSYNINLSNGFKMLENSVKAGNTDVVKVLLENGLSVNDDVYVVNAPIRTNNLELIKVLLLHGAQLPKKSYSYREVPNLDSIETLQLILSYNPEIHVVESLLELYLLKNNLEAVNLIMKDSTSLNNSCDNYVLHACSNNNMDILKLLFEKGAKIKKGSDSGVIQACKNNNLEMLKLLFERNPNLVLKKNYGLNEAIGHQNVDIIKLLIKHDADVNEHVESIVELAKNLNDHDLINYCRVKEV
ncbi:putative ankyrin repeat protein L63 [Zancudomyces culisetae]|uniref:Putative ankyrin repeat protein L63 n=1 Tax=Zancudomyces culisetae TaxID=1213189 RepID=A0A1R1PXZ0_ZANCU|nr:putative ankyrin repeat protein L63 [Zancudomyces culisetae]|eukprot:OMH85830.1 putative ankyrin repeat protein L63 [Zancudomyces culisetae]